MTLPHSQVEIRWSGEGTAPFAGSKWLSWPLHLPLPKSGDTLELAVQSVLGKESTTPVVVDRVSSLIYVEEEYGIGECRAVIWLAPAAQRR